MRFLKPKHTVHSVARQILEGLRDGTVVLDLPPPPQSSEGKPQALGTEPVPLTWVLTASLSEAPFWSYIGDPVGKQPSSRQKRETRGGVRYARSMVAAGGPEEVLRDALV